MPTDKEMKERGFGNDIKRVTFTEGKNKEGTPQLMIDGFSGFVDTHQLTGFLMDNFNGQKLANTVGGLNASRIQVDKTLKEINAAIELAPPLPASKAPKEVQEKAAKEIAKLKEQAPLPSDAPPRPGFRKRKGGQ